MIDRITFAAPLGLIGMVMERAVLAGSMRRLIEERNAFLKTAAERAAAGGDHGR